MRKSNRSSQTTLALMGISGILGVALIATWGKLHPTVPAKSAAVKATPSRIASTDRHINIELTNAAWHALDRKEYKKAIEQAQLSIEEYEVDAERIQLRLEKSELPAPSTYKEIFSQGPLNDVAASYFIIGKASEALVP